MVTTAALSLLLVVLVVATTGTLRVAIAASIAADLALNYFFMPPYRTLTIADPQNWVALFAFLAVSATASSLSSSARARAREAMDRRDELARLFDLSRDVLLTTDSRDAVVKLAEAVSRRFELEAVAICLPGDSDWEVSSAGPPVELDRQALSSAFAAASAQIEFDAHARTYSGHGVMPVGGQMGRIVPLRVGTRAVGLLVAAGRPIEPGTLDALAGVVAIAIERAQLLEARKAAELARQGDALKSALLASLAHDLRTPLTAIRVAASNLNASWLQEPDRREQSDLILAEVERLDRLFQNILDMARIDAGAVSPELRWVHPAEIAEAARSQVEHVLRRRRVDVSVPSDGLVRVDPRLIASALARLLENAAQYSPADTPIGLTMAITPEGVTATVRDHGPGIAAADIPHLFDRFYRGVAAKEHASGTGMGLSIARGILAAEGGRVWGENAPDGGARFTIAVPAETREGPPAAGEV